MISAILSFFAKKQFQSVDLYQNLISSWMTNKEKVWSQLGPHFSHNRFMIESDVVYNDFRVARMVCSILDKVNAQDHINIDQEAGAFPQNLPQEDYQFDKFSQQHVDSYFSFAQSVPKSPIDPDGFFQSYGDGMDETQRTQMQSLGLGFQDSRGSIRKEDSFFGEFNFGIGIKLKQESEGSSESQGISKEPTNTKNSLTFTAPTREEKAYNKNLVCYIAKTIRRMMFGKFRASVSRICQKHGVSFESFSKYCEERKFNGVNALITLLEGKSDASECKMQNIFKHLFRKMLRRAYLRTAIGQGKMAKLQAYADFKNKYLLHLDQVHKE